MWPGELIVVVSFSFQAVLRYARILVEEMHLSIYSENSMKVWDEYFEALENLFPESYWRADNSVKKVKDQLWSILEVVLSLILRKIWYSCS